MVLKLHEYSTVTIYSNVSQFSAGLKMLYKYFAGTILKTAKESKENFGIAFKFCDLTVSKLFFQIHSTEGVIL